MGVIFDWLGVQKLTISHRTYILIRRFPRAGYGQIWLPNATTPQPTLFIQSFEGIASKPPTIFQFLRFPRCSFKDTEVQLLSGPLAVSPK